MTESNSNTEATASQVIEPTFEAVETAIYKHVVEEKSALEKGLEAAEHNIKLRFISGIGSALSGFTKAIKDLHRECMIFKRLETHMRNGTVTTEVITETMKDLDEHRANVQQTNAEAAAKAAAAAKASS